MVSFLQVFLTHAVIIILLVITGFALRDYRRSIQSQLLIALAICLICVNLAEALRLHNDNSIVQQLIRYLGAPNLGLLWWFCLSLLKDNFRLNRWHYSGMVLLCVFPLIHISGGTIPFWPALKPIGGLMPFIMMSHIIWTATIEMNGDLVESRRRLRMWIVAGVTLAAFISVASEFLTDTSIAIIARSVIAIIVGLLILHWLTRTHLELLTFDQAIQHQKVKPNLDPRDQELRERLDTAMEVGLKFLESSLTIRDLATYLKCPDHRLRSVINIGLGHKNFATYLNTYRINFAKNLLADPKESRTQILSVALNSGFASLPTFNRVFRELEGQAPSEYRKNALLQTDQN